MVPAPGQGALALQVRGGDEASAAAVAAVTDERALRELTAERAVVAPLGASCATPVGVHARAEGTHLAIEAFIGLPDGSEWLRDRIEAEGADPLAAGAELAERLLGAGAAELLRRAEEWAGPNSGLSGSKASSRGGRRA
jgi:hydroxymethylbilane synthase